MHKDEKGICDFSDYLHENIGSNPCRNWRPVDKKDESAAQVPNPEFKETEENSRFAPKCEICMEGSCDCKSSLYKEPVNSPIRDFDPPLGTCLYSGYPHQEWTGRDSKCLDWLPVEKPVLVVDKRKYTLPVYKSLLEQITDENHSINFVKRIHERMVGEKSTGNPRVYNASKAGL